MIRDRFEIAIGLMMMFASAAATIIIPCALVLALAATFGAI